MMGENDNISPNYINDFPVTGKNDNVSPNYINDFPVTAIFLPYIRTTLINNDTTNSPHNYQESISTNANSNHQYNVPNSAPNHNYQQFTSANNFSLHHIILIRNCLVHLMLIYILHSALILILLNQLLLLCQELIWTIKINFNKF